MRRVAVVLSLCLAACALAQDRPARFCRYPALSPDGSVIAFSYQGNLWTVPSGGGVASRLTAASTIDYRPRWSPDGRWIAFVSDREGGNEIFLISSQGGRVRQLTYHGLPTRLMDWYPDGRHLLVSHSRFTMEAALYKLDIETGRMTPVLQDRVAPDNAVISPDGTRLAYQRGALFDTYRRNYVGSANHDIYIGPLDGSKAPNALFRDPQRMNDTWPLWAGDSRSVYWVHDTGKHSELMRIGTEAGRPEVVWSNPPDQLRFGSAARNGSKLAFECLNQIAVFDTASRSGRLIDVICRTDERASDSSPIALDSTGVQQFAVSPDGKRTAFVVRGDVFVVNNERGGEAKRLTRSPHRDDNIEWTKDGKSIVFASTVDDTINLYQVELASLQVKRLTEGPWIDSAPRFSPNGKWLAYIRTPRPSLRIRNAEGTIDRELVAGPGIASFEWSPDGKWIAYVRTYGYWNSEVYLVELDEAGNAVRTLPFTEHPGRNMQPQWLKNGEKVVFMSNRTRNRDAETLNQTGRFALYVTSLEKPKVTFDFDEDTEPEPPKPDPKQPVTVKVDPEDLHQRAQAIFPFFEPITTFRVAPDNQTVVFVASSLGQSDFWQMNIDGTGLTRLTTGGEGGSALEWSADGSRLYYLRGGAIRWIGKGGQGRGAVNFIARMEIDRIVDYYAAFDEAWATINERFYDPNFHGVDWKAMRAKYRPFIEDVSIRADLTYLVEQMLGELNASHMGFRASGAEGRPSRPIGALGIEPDPAFHGVGVKVGRVVPRTPAAHPQSRLLPGEIILTVDGAAVHNGLSYDVALREKVGRTVVLTVLGLDNKERKVKIRPVAYGAVRDQFYEEWIAANRKRVDELSGGKLGYLHVADMGDAARNRFERELFGFGRSKEGMVLDFRFNNGGDTHDSLLQFLDRRKQYLTFVPRTDAPYKQPEHVFTKPTIVLVDEFSLSDAEVFTMGYKELKIGKVVGRPTMGWIIFTSGRQLLDGSFIRTPYIATLAADGRNMENWGVPPDIEVWFEPGDFLAGRDPQLSRAVQELLKSVPGR